MDTSRGRRRQPRRSAGEGAKNTTGPPRAETDDGRAGSTAAYAGLLKRLIEDPDFRVRFRHDPAVASREAGLEAVPNQTDAEGRPPLETLEMRESRSAFAGVMVVGLLEGVGLVEHVVPGLGAQEAVAAGLQPSAAPNGQEAMAQAGPDEVTPTPSDDQQIATEEPEDGSEDDEPDEDEPDEDEPDEDEPDEEEPDADDSEQPDEPGPGADDSIETDPDDGDDQSGGATGGGSDDAHEAPSESAPAPPEPNGKWKPDPDQYGMAGGGGPRSPLDTAVLRNPNITLDPDGEEDFTEGRMDPRLSAMLLKLADKHTITLSATTSDHPQLTAGGSTSNHWYGRGVDIATVDGEIVRPNSAASRALLSELTALDASIRPDEVGSPWALAAPGFSTDGAHQDHLHIAYDRAITPRWEPPIGLMGAMKPPVDPADAHVTRVMTRVMPSVRRNGSTSRRTGAEGE